MGTKNKPTLVGTQVDDYELIEQLGTDEFAAVYRAVDVRLNRRVAIKVILLPEAIADDDVRYLLEQAQDITRLAHPNIVSMYDSGVEDGFFYMVMEYIQGDDLATLLKSVQADKAYTNNEDIVKVADEVGAALDYAHKHGVLHHNLNPRNIMLDNNDRVIVTDFGVDLLSVWDEPDEILGTAYYRAPEQIDQAAEIGPRADLYAFAVIMYEMITNRLPYEASPLPVLSEIKRVDPVPSPLYFRPELPDKIVRVLSKALSPAPEVRYPTGTAFAEALEAALYDKPLPPVEIPPPPSHNPVNMIYNEEYDAPIITSAPPDDVSAPLDDVSAPPDDVPPSVPIEPVDAVNKVDDEHDALFITPADEPDDILFSEPVEPIDTINGVYGAQGEEFGQPPREAEDVPLSEPHEPDGPAGAVDGEYVEHVPPFIAVDDVSTDVSTDASVDVPAEDEPLEDTYEPQPPFISTPSTAKTRESARAPESDIVVTRPNPIAPHEDTRPVKKSRMPFYVLLGALFLVAVMCTGFFVVSALFGGLDDTPFAAIVPTQDTSANTAGAADVNPTPTPMAGDVVRMDETLAVTTPDVPPVVIGDDDGVGDSQPEPEPQLLSGGQGLTTGRTMQSGEVEVEGYCVYLNENYDTEEDGVNWYCTRNGQRVVTLDQQNFNEICQMTYNNPDAYAVQTDNSQTPAYNWLCFEDGGRVSTSGDTSTENTAANPAGTYTLEIRWRGEDSLFITNTGAASFPLNELFLNGNGQLNGSDWGVERLERGQCVAVWADSGNPSAATTDCQLVGNRIVRGSDNRFWKTPFDVLYMGDVTATCEGTPCTVSISR